MKGSPRRICCVEVIFMYCAKNQKKRIRIAAIILCVALLRLIMIPSYAAVGNPETAMTLDCESAVLMEASTGTVLFEQNADLTCPPASITKIMTLLLIMEAIEAGTLRTDEIVTASAHAASMGGSQIYLKEGERMSVEDLIKSVVISSANDAALALAEHLCGNEETFVARMNDKATELGMINTHFENTNGLDDTVTNHVTTARDVAIMSRALMGHNMILKYSSIWMDTIRDGAFGLTNTNRLIRFYPGATGLKTGSTSKAGFCISATAQRNGMSLICVIMGAQTRDIRNAEAKKLLDWGFAGYEVYSVPEEPLQPLQVLGGVRNLCEIDRSGFTCVLPKGGASSLEIEVELPDQLQAPVSEGQSIGCVRYRYGGHLLGQVEIIAAETVEKIGFGGLFVRMLCYFTGKY